MVSPNPIAATIILIFGLQALVLSVLLLLKRPKRQSNFFLALGLFFFALMTVNISMGNFLFSYELVHVFRYFQLELLFGIGPALYFFTKSSMEFCVIFPQTNYGFYFFFHQVVEHRIVISLVHAAYYPDNGLMYTFQRIPG